MLSKAKHLAFLSGYEVEILRLRLRMTLRHSLTKKGIMPHARIELISVKFEKSKSCFFSGVERGLRRTAS